MSRRPPSALLLAGLLSALLLRSGRARADAVEVELRERGTGALVAEGWLLVAGQRWEAPQGRVRLDLPPGDHVVQVASPLHEPVELVVSVPADQVLKLYLRRDQAPLEIVVEARRESPHASRQVFDRERVEKTPGTFDDPVRLIQSLPGVAVAREFGPGVGQVAIRGADPAESRYYLDGIELPYLYHFDQYASVVPARALDEVAVYPSAFGPAFGDAVGGVVAVRTRAPEVDRAHGAADVNLIMAGAQLSTPVGEHLAISASGRRSYLDLVSRSNDQYTLWPVFYDFNGRIDWKPTVDHRVSLLALGGGDAYARYAGDTAALDPLEAEAEPVLESDRDFQVLRLQARDELPGAVLDSVVGVVSDRFGAEVGEAVQDRGLLRASLRHEAQVLLGPHVLALGGDLHGERWRLRAEVDRAWPELAGEAPLLEAGLPLDETPMRLQGGAFVEPRLALGPATVQPGLRVQAGTILATPALDPRLAVQVALPREVRLRLGSGLYSQAPSAEELALGQVQAAWIRAVHGVAGVDLAVAGRLELTAEAWARRRWQVPTGAEAPVNSDAAGLELSSRYRLRERIFAWAVLTLGRARQDGHRGPYDQPYAVNLVGSWDFARGWNAGLRWRLAAGLPYTEVVDATYDGDQDRYLPVEGEPYAARMPTYQKLDLHLQRDWDLRTWRLSLYLELWWVPPGANRLYPVYSYDYSEQAYVVGPPLVPLVGLRATF